MKLAAQLYTVREHTKNELEVYKMFKKIAEIGYNAVQISGFVHYDPIFIKKCLDEFNLKVCATHSSLDRLLNETDKVIEENLLFKSKYVGLGFMKADSIDGYKNFLDSVQPAVEKIHKNGMKFVYHNHAHEFIKYEKICPLDFMRDNTDPEKFGFLADFYWIQTAGLSPEKFINDYKGRLDVVHFKDMRYKPDSSSMAEIFEGNMDYKKIYNSCIENNVKWAAIELDICDNDPFESLEISFNNLKTNKMFNL